MKKLLFTLTALYVALSVTAQAPMGMGKGQVPSIGRIYGKLVDSAGRGIRDASVVLLQSKMDTATKKMKQVLLKGVSSQGNGDFNLENLPIFGQLKLTITAIGYKPYDQAVAFQMKMPQGGAPTGNSQTPDMSAIASNFEKDLGKITMKTDAQQLSAVVVTATSGRLRMDIDKKVFNVSQNIVSAGGTAVDVMKNVPSVNVDIDGNVTLRNATPQIYIDGRPTTLTLDQIPADAIESVEVITNPSAKYDASGGNAGILNIILKKNKKSGYNGNVTAGVDKRGGINGGGSFNVRQNKINVSVSTFGNEMRNRSTSSTDIRNLLASPNLLVDQIGKSRMNGGFLFGRVGVDYFATNRTTFSLAAIKVHGEFKPSDFLRTDSAFEGGSYVSYSERNTKTKREFNANGLQGSFKYQFAKKGEELTADANFFSGKNNNNAFYNTNIYSSYGGTQKGNIQQQIIGSGTNQFFTIQSDYVNPFKGSAKLEAGVRAQLRKLSNGQGNYFYEASSGEFMLIPSATSNYKNTDNVYAAYTSFTNSLEASYSKTLKGNNTILASVYYKHSTNLITRFLDTITVASGDKRPISTYINANSSRSIGTEITSQNTFTKWWDANTNINFYNSKINTDNITGSSQKALWSWFAKMNNNFKLPKNFKLQLSGTYQSKTNLPINKGGGFGPGGGGPPGGGSQSAAQGYIKSNYGIDAGLQ